MPPWTAGSRRLWSPWTAGAGAMLWSDYASGFSSYLCRNISLFIAHTPCQRQHLVSPCARAMRATRKGWRRGETRLAKCAKRTPITSHSSETISVLPRASVGPSRLHGLPHPRTRPTIVRAALQRIHLDRNSVYWQQRFATGTKNNRALRELRWIRFYSISMCRQLC